MMMMGEKSHAMLVSNNKIFAKTSKQAKIHFKMLPMIHFPLGMTLKDQMSVLEQFYRICATSQKGSAAQEELTATQTLISIAQTSARDSLKPEETLSEIHQQKVLKYEARIQAILLEMQELLNAIDETLAGVQDSGALVPHTKETELLQQMDALQNQARAAGHVLALVKAWDTATSADVLDMMRLLIMVENDEALCALLLFEGSDLDLNEKFAVDEAESVMSLLHHLCCSNAALEKSLEFLLALPAAFGLNLNARDAHQQTPLFIAAAKGCVKPVQRLLALPIKRGVNINARNYRQATPLMACGPRSSIFQLFLDLPVPYGLDINAEDDIGSTVLILACANNWISAVRKLLALPPERGLNLSVSGESGYTALYVAIEWKCNEIAKLLIDHPAMDLNARVRLPQLPLLHHAMKSRTFNKEIVDYLIALPEEKGFDINATDDEGNTALLRSVYMSMFDVAQLLLDLPESRGLNLRAVNRGGKAALYWARLSAPPEIVTQIETRLLASLQSEEDKKKKEDAPAVPVVPASPLAGTKRGRSNV